MATSSDYDVEKHIILDVFPKTCLFNLLGFFFEKLGGPFTVLDALLALSLLLIIPLSSKGDLD